ncbi:[protein-PII] uridylyltransferase [Pseudonocardia eucalypti]|uniref:Bifunctional uridylyltransferase/uridylyl-removing enzyme n=1 Tax=Pseudonocardia eucalypti TaxID=648755 RepID=A0ABP9QEI7_9PSEU|nr:[protein-PII] uridylyltransferase [Pseudonocardia eucalypti]
MGTNGGIADDLVRAREALLSPGPGQRRLAPEALRGALVDLHDFWLASRAAAIGLAEGAALVAVGALGRRELVPHSDLDLVMVHDFGKRAGAGTDADRLAEALWYPLWDAGIGLDHSVRTPGQVMQVAATDLRAALGLLEARHLAGEQALFDKVNGAVRQAWRAGIRNRFNELVEFTNDRWVRNGDVAHRVEPDLKNGRGGLRDVYLLDALAAAQLVDRPGADVAAARLLLLDVRTELHRSSGRARDVLRAEDADEIAGQLDMGDRFDLMRALSGAARTVAYAVDTSLRAAKGAMPRRGLAALRRAPVRRPLDEGVVEHAGEVTLARDASAAKDPALVLRVAATAARTGMPIAAGTLTRLADTAPELRTPWPRAAVVELLSLLGAGRSLVNVVEALDRGGLWGRFFPEWGAVRDLPPRDRAHVWTVDRHLVETSAQAARLTTQVARPDLLLLGALLHDIGKGREEDHSVVGEGLARQVGTRLGLPDADVDTLAAMVRHHLLLPDTATRRDPDDPATISRVVDTLGKDPRLLELLHALAEADSLATGPGVWSPFKRRLMADLVGRCRAVMNGEEPPRPRPLDPAAQEMAERAADSGRAGVVVLSPDLPEAGEAPGEDGLCTVLVTMPDRPGTLSLAAGILALHSLEVHVAELGSHGGVAVDTFTVSPRFGRMPDPAVLRESLAKALDGTLHLPEALARKERDYAQPAGPEDRVPPRVLWFDDEATGAVVLELRGTDRIGLLFRVAAAVESCAADVRWAKVETLGASVVDSFCLVGPDGKATLSRAQRRALEEAVLTAATG